MGPRSSGRLEADIEMPASRTEGRRLQLSAVLSIAMTAEFCKAWAIESEFTVFSQKLLNRCSGDSMSDGPPQLSKPAAQTAARHDTSISCASCGPGDDEAIALRRSHAAGVEWTKEQEISY